MRKVGQEVLGRMVRKLGGIEAAAARLGITASLLERFLTGANPVPDSVLLKAMDYALDDAPPAPTPAVAGPITPKRKPVI